MGSAGGTNRLTHRQPALAQGCRCSRCPVPALRSRRAWSAAAPPAPAPARAPRPRPTRLPLPPGVAAAARPRPPGSCPAPASPCPGPAHIGPVQQQWWEEHWAGGERGERGQALTSGCSALAPATSWPVLANARDSRTPSTAMVAARTQSTATALIAAGLCNRGRVRAIGMQRAGKGMQGVAPRAAWGAGCCFSGSACHTPHPISRHSLSACRGALPPRLASARGCLRPNPPKPALVAARAMPGATRPALEAA